MFLFGFYLCLYFKSIVLNKFENEQEMFISANYKMKLPLWFLIKSFSHHIYLVGEGSVSN